MIVSAIGLVLVLVGLIALALQRLYSSIPAKELKRLAQRGDHLAEGLHRPVAYGASLRLLLWIVVGLSLAGGFVLLATHLSAWLAFMMIGLGLVAVIWVQTLRLTVRSAHLAIKATPALSKSLHYLHSPLDIISRVLGRIRAHSPHSGLYEKEDVLALLRQQRGQRDNRIAEADLDFIERAIQFDDRHAADIMLLWDKLRQVSADDSIGPVLLGELHDSGQSSFLVYDKKPANVVGTLSLRDAVAAKTGGTVSSLMKREVAYVHEDFSLRQALQAFLTTRQYVVVVVNSFEEPVGVITLDHLLAQLLSQPADEDLVYEDRAAVAAYKPQLAAEVPELTAAEEPRAGPEIQQAVDV